MIKCKLTQKRLKELLEYDPETGIFTWRASRPGIKSTRVAGWEEEGDYRYISVDSRTYMIHRLAWLYTEGYFPENFIDHINRIKGDNRIKNLREVSKVCNARNCKLSSRSTSGVTGVSWNKLRRNYRSHIRIPGESIYLGSFKTKLEAVRSRWNAEVRYEFPSCNTTSSAYQYLKEHGSI